MSGGFRLRCLNPLHLRFVLPAEGDVLQRLSAFADSFLGRITRNRSLLFNNYCWQRLPPHGLRVLVEFTFRAPPVGATWPEGPYVVEDMGGLFGPLLCLPDGFMPSELLCSLNCFSDMDPRVSRAQREALFFA